MKKIYVQIPEPCHEDWNKMTPLEQGRFCRSCCKEVIDFTIMSDHEIISFLSKPKGHTCGNFLPGQLNRAITEPKGPSKKWSWGVMLSFLVTLAGACKQKAENIAGKINAVPVEAKKEEHSTEIPGEFYLPGDVAGKKDVDNEINIKGEVVTEREEQIRITCVIPELYPDEEVLPVELYGRVMDIDSNPIPFALIKLVGGKEAAWADGNGYYRIFLPSQKNIEISISSVGYESTDISVSLVNENVKRDITLNEKVCNLDTIVVSSALQEYGLIGFAGGLSVIREEPVTASKAIIDTVKNFFNTSIVKLYPNPAIKGSIVNVEINNASEYTAALFDNQSRLISQAAFSITKKRQAYQLNIPSSLAAGIYYVIVTDKKTKKQYTEKLVIQ